MTYHSLFCVLKLSGKAIAKMDRKFLDKSKSFPGPAFKEIKLLGEKI